jgi:hypothetical protein
MKKKSISKRKVLNKKSRSVSNIRRNNNNIKIKSIRKKKSLRTKKKYDGMHNGGSPNNVDEENENVQILGEINSRLNISDQFEMLNIDFICDMIKDVMTKKKTLLIVQSEYLNDDSGVDVAENFDKVVSNNVKFVVSVDGFYIEPVGEVELLYSDHKILSFEFQSKQYVALVDTQKDRVKPGDISAISAMSEDDDV